MKALVSILIPAFNAERWIAQTLRSAIEQTWESKEIIVVDDGSVDETVAIARQFESDLVQVVRQSNQGAAAARNKAFSLCRGDYVQWLDADDLLAPDKIEKQMEALGGAESRRILLSSEWGRFIYRSERAKFVPTALWRDLSPAEWLVRRMGQNLYMQTATWLVSRALSEAAGPWDTGLLSDDDQEYFCRVLLASDGVRFVPGARVYYRASGYGSLSYIGTSEKKRQAHWRSIQLHIEYLRSLEDSERARAACVKFVRDRMAVFYPEQMDIFRQAEELCSRLGGRLAAPRLPWKYAWIRPLFGWRLARHAQWSLPKLRWSLIRLCDQAFYCLDGSRCAADRATRKSVLPAAAQATMAAGDRSETAHR